MRLFHELDPDQIRELELKMRMEEKVREWEKQKEQEHQKSLYNG